MNLAIVCNDTRGGVQPYVALSIGLKRAGFNVRAVCPAHSSSMFSQNDIPVVEELGTAEEFVDASRRAAEGGLIEAIRLQVFEAAPKLKRWQEQTIRACDGAQIIIGGIGGMVTGIPAAARLNVPFVQMHLQPIFAPSAEYQGVLAPKILAPFGGPANHLGHLISDSIVKMMLMGKAPKTSEHPIFYGLSQKIVPVKSSGTTTRFANGYWTLKNFDNWSPPLELNQFLEKADDVICIGFGSMVTKNPESFYRKIIAAIKRAGARAVILTGWHGAVSLDQDEQVFLCNEVPHSWLFDRVRAIVHHGGAGTTGAAFTAGKPQIVVPFGVDQPFWGARVHTLGAGPMPIPRPQLSVDNLLASMKEALTNERMKERAAHLGQALREEAGVDRTVEQFQNLFS